MFFKKGLKDSSLILKLIMTSPRMSEEMLAITNKYTLVEEVTLNPRVQKQEKQSGHAEQPSSSQEAESGSFCQHGGIATMQRGVSAQTE
jgi:hypothetical protein